MSCADDVVVYLLILAMCSQTAGSLAFSGLVVLAFGPFAKALECGAVIARFSGVASELELIAVYAHNDARGIFGAVEQLAEWLWYRGDYLLGFIEGPLGTVGRAGNVVF